MIRTKSIKAILWLLMLLSALAATYPFVYMVLLSLTQSPDVYLRFDEGISLVNFARVQRNFNFFLHLANSTIVAVGSCFLNCLLGSMAAFGFAKKDFPGKQVLFLIVLSTMMIPSQVKIIPVFLMMRQARLLNTHIALILPLVTAFSVFLVKQFLESLPDELLEAAYMDGCSEPRLFFSIVLPLIKPVLVTLTIFSFITAWNDFIWPLVVASDTRVQTLTLALSVLKGNYATNYGLVMAGSTLTFLPPFILYVFLQKQFVEGIALSGIKG
jgi:multiple sugar transport system permease protein